MPLIPLSLVTAIIFAIYLFWRLARSQGFLEETIFDLAFLVLLGVVIGGRIYYIIQGENILDFKFSWLGIYLGAYFLGNLYIKRYKFSFWKLADLGVFSFLIINLVYFGASYNWYQLGAFLVLSLYLFWLFKNKFAVGFYFLNFLFFASIFRIIQGSLSEKQSLFFFIFPLAFIVFSLIELRVIYQKQERNFLFDFKEAMALTKDFINRMKQKLLGQLKEAEDQAVLLQSEDPYFEPGRTEANAEEMGEAGEDLGHQEVEVSRGFLQEKIEQIKKALGLIEKGGYGICEKCGQPIDRARLEANPEATRCIECEKERPL